MKNEKIMYWKEDNTVKYTKPAVEGSDCINFVCKECIKKRMYGKIGA